MPLITCPNVGCRKDFKYRMEKKHHLESKNCQGLPPETSNSIVKRDNGYLCLLCNAVIKHSNNINRHKKLCKKIKSYCLPVMYATSNSNLNANWRGTSKFIPELFLFATSARRVSRGKTT